MRGWPQTLSGQISLVSFIVLLVVQLIGLGLLLDNRGRLNYKLLAEYAAQRMAGIATVLDQAEAEERPLLVRALSVQPTTLSINIPWATDNIDRSEDAKMFSEDAAEQMVKPMEIQVLALERLDPIMMELHPPRFAEPNMEPFLSKFIKGKMFARTYVAQIRLHDGSTVTFHHLLPVPATDLPYRLITLLLVLGLATTALSIWSVRRLTRPLANFAKASSGFAHNLNQAPMVESGPQEIRQAAHAFNAMQTDIKRMIETRAQALSAVSHDLRLPITRMRLRLEGDIAPALRQKIEHDLTEMDAMIGHTLEFLRAGSNAEVPVAVNFDALIDSVVEDMEELGTTIIRHGKCNNAIKARPHALRRCITNLLDNARFYGNGAIHLNVADSDRQVRIEIIDDGPGIPEEYIEKVFEPYFRLEASRARHTGGSGLGLSIAKAIAETHGGSVKLESPPGQGVSVIVTLPR
jgi:signal transduction histidine kinase